MKIASRFVLWPGSSWTPAGRSRDRAFDGPRSNTIVMGAALVGAASSSGSHGRSGLKAADGCSTLVQRLQCANESR